MTVLDRMKDLLTRFENNDPALDSEILKIYSEKVKTRQQNELNSKLDVGYWLSTWFGTRLK